MSACPECGCDSWHSQDYPRLAAQLVATQDEIRRMAARHAVEVAESRLAALERESARAAGQSKVKRQRAEISRLEKKLRSLGRQPYAEEDDQ